MTALQDLVHTATVSRELHGDLWRVDCPTCGPVAVGQGYRDDARLIAVKHREAHARPSNAGLPETEKQQGHDDTTDLRGRAHAGRLRTHQLPRERLERDPDSAL